MERLNQNLFFFFSTDTSSQFSVDIVEVTPTSQNMELKEQIINETNGKEIVLNASRLQVESEKWKSNSKKQYYKLWYNNKKVYYFLVCKKIKYNITILLWRICNIRLLRHKCVGQELGNFFRQLTNQGNVHPCLQR